MFRYTRLTAIREAATVLSALALTLPFYLLLVTAFKPRQELLTTSPIEFSSNSSFNAFREILAAEGTASIGSGLWFSTLVTGTTILGLVLVGSVTGYVLSRKLGRTRNIVYYLIVAGIVVPAQLGVIPLYVGFRTLGLLGTWYGLSLLYIGALTPLAVFLYSGFARSISREYEEAAIVDGAGRLSIFARIAFPLMAPATGTVAILTGLIAWNDFFIALIFLSGSGQAPLTVVMYQYVGGLTNRWDLIFAVVIVSMIPVLAFYLFAQRKFIQGFSGGIKA